MSGAVRLLEPRFVERIWGTTRLAPLFPDQDRKIGEVWFDAGPAFPLLIKFIFTSERLSVQVHPDDAYAQSTGNLRGKTEMWHILAAEPDSTIALGFREDVGKDGLRQAIADGRVEELLNWIPVKPGDTYFAEAGTVHAIGAGITLCEIQQNSDITYRLYDYGRRRELHLEHGLAVSNTSPYDGRREYPVSCEHFVTDLVELTEPANCAAGCDGVLIVLEGNGRLGETAVAPGNVCLVSAESSSVAVKPNGRLKLLHARCPA
jgi:mannose-6-phosphate isomerase